MLFGQNVLGNNSRTQELGGLKDSVESVKPKNKTIKGTKLIIEA